MEKPLTALPPGGEGVVVKISGGRGLSRRLLEMGLTPGTLVKVLVNSRGPIIVLVRGVSIALGRGIASRVIVKVTT